MLLVDAATGFEFYRFYELLEGIITDISWIYSMKMLEYAQYVVDVNMKSTDNQIQNYWCFQFSTSV